MDGRIILDIPHRGPDGGEFYLPPVSTAVTRNGKVGSAPPAGGSASSRARLLAAGGRASPDERTGWCPRYPLARLWPRALHLWSAPLRVGEVPAAPEGLIELDIGEQ